MKTIDRSYHMASNVWLRAAVSAATSTLVLAASTAHAAQGLDLGPIGGALGETKPIVDARMRYENVDQTPLAEESDADTLRLRLGFETGKAWNTSLLAEGEFVWPFDGDYREDNAVGLNTAYPVIADPESYEINRLHLTNTSLPGTTLTLGRQRILLDDQRFVGNVGWRQNEQTFDALRVVNKSLATLTVDATYLNQVNRVFGPDSPQGRYEGDGFLANVAYQFPFGKLTGFGYVFDFDPIAAATFRGLTAAQAAALNPIRASSETYGVRFAGERPLSKFKVSYVASYATQEDYGSNPFAFDLDYYLAELTGTYRQFGLTLGQEVLEGNGTVGFVAPLGTLHKFNGWADKFLTTPANGIDDRYASFGYLMKGVARLDTLSATLAYHDYETERLAVDLGDELNIQLQAKYQRFLGTLKYADYDAKTGVTPVTYRDTVKYWVMVDYVW
jgi:hypothetical protein